MVSQHRLESLNGLTIFIEFMNIILFSGPPCGFRDPEALLPVAFIIGGSLVMEGTWPWVGAILLDGNYVCTGSLINDQWFLTAAHCITQSVVSRYEVLLGEYFLAVVHISENIYAFACTRPN